MSGGQVPDAPGKPRRRGRPPGSVALTEERAHLILSYIRAGAFDHVAAEAAGVSARTFRDWMARGEGTHPTRGPTPTLRRFARDVRTAEAEARVGAEVRVYRDHPTYWLSHAARSRPEREGWTDPGPDQAASHGGLEEVIRALDLADAEEAAHAARAATADCSDEACTCIHHRRRYDHEYNRVRGPHTD